MTARSSPRAGDTAGERTVAECDAMVFLEMVSVLRGRASPIQVFLASLLGVLLGFVPGFSQAPGLLLLWVLLLLVLNANIGLSLLLAGLSRLAALLLMPVSFAVGRWLQEGPLRPLVEAAVNGPGTAFMGLEYPAAAGGLLLGAVLGVLVGIALVSLLLSVRRRLAKIEAGNDRFRKVEGNVVTRFLLWLMIGGRRGNLTYAEMLAKGRGSPIRLWGVAVAALLVGAVFVAPELVSGPLLAGATRSGLQRVTGATVEVGDAQLSTADQRISLGGLALADPQNLSTDMLRAQSVVADLDVSDLLRRRFVVEQLVVAEALSGAPRDVPGELIGEPEPAPPVEPGLPLPDGRPDLEKAVEEVRVWKERVATLRRWIERLAPEPDEPSAPGEEDESLGDILERRAHEIGWARVKDDTLVHGAPHLLVREAVATGLRLSGLDDTLLDVQAFNLSTQPSLVAEPPRLVIRSRDGRIDLDLVLDENAGERLQQALEQNLIAPLRAEVDARVAEARAELEGRVQGELDQRRQEAAGKVQDAASEAAGKVGDALGGLFGGDEDEDEPKKKKKPKADADGQP